jgi:hypothetical protein|tara:strand:+ start:342 stop:617 length:276 start_codon:yes stop_codon:yes gene_type:complete
MNSFDASPGSRDESFVWAMCYHLKTAVTLMEVAIKNDLVKNKELMQYIEGWAEESESIWEEHMWIKFQERIDKPDNVVYASFSPEASGPDS